MRIQAFLIRGIASLAITVGLTLSSGLVIAHPGHSAPSDKPAETKSAETKPQLPAASHHPSIEIPAGQPKPTAQLILTPDPMKGWNMQIQTTNFTFAPEQIGRRSNTSEGHAHLYLNGKKIARVYGTWSHIPSLPAGTNTLRITLNTNNHEDLTIGGKVVEATAIIEVPAAPTAQPTTSPPTMPPGHHPH